MKIKNFEDLQIWTAARRLTRDIYTLSKAPQFSKDLALRDQIRRAGVSIMSNIAEGFERGGNQEFVQYLYIAKGSCGEIRSQLYVALDQEYVDQKVADSLVISLKRLSVMIKHLIDHLKRSGMRGPKYGNSNQPTHSETL
ncbi:MAG TPA: four helix bundle protein [Candidatus Binatia bacterium]|jgi:four helix bundle protein|nr:four helix bundle protein [Candidatus Binatia bacterium]